MKLDREIYRYQQMINAARRIENGPDCDCDDCQAEHDELVNNYDGIVDARGGDNMEWRRSSPVGAAYGIELELEAAPLKNRRAIVDAFPEPIEGDHPMPIFENDASLVNGVEIIFPPVKAEVLRDPASYIRRALSAVEDSKTSVMKTNAGMHINVNTRGWSAKSKQVFLAVINTMPIAKLQAIGGRSLNEYCRQYSSPLNPVLQPLYLMNGLAGHRYAAEMHEARIECRYPVAKVDPAHLIKNLTFIELVSKFVKGRSQERQRVTLTSHAWPEFNTWLQLQETDDARSIREAIA